MRPRFDVRKEVVYLDNAATTMVDDEVAEAMQPFWEEEFGNSGSAHHLGRNAREAIEEAREHVAVVLQVDPSTIYFTSGATEANNWAIKGFDGTPLCSDVEHSSVLASVLRCGGSTVPVDGNGTLDLTAMQGALSTPDVSVVSVQHANNEVGTVQPVKVVGEMCQLRDVLFHVDAAQTFGKVETNIGEMGADMVSVSAHKIHGPVGVGALYVADGVRPRSLVDGGGQQDGMRSGTMPVPLIVGFGRAALLAWSRWRSKKKAYETMAARMEKELGVMMGAVRNGDPSSRLPNIVSLTVPDVEASMVAAMLDQRHNICVSCGAACKSFSSEVSHVLKAMGRTSDQAFGTIRVSMGWDTTEHDVEVFIGALGCAVKEARERSFD